MTKLGVVMDPISKIKIEKDSTFAMLLEAEARGWEVWYMEQRDLVALDGQVQARMRRLRLRDDPNGWYSFDGQRRAPLSDLDVVLMRKDPPFDMEYIYTTYLLDLAEADGVLVVNQPQALRDANEKMYTTLFPQCTPPTLVAQEMGQFKDFLALQKDVVVKPLDGMGGASIFRLKQGDPNTNVVLETLTSHGRRFAMAQRFVPEITTGDKRILLVDGEPIPHGLARVPPPGDSRGNLAVGGVGHGVELSERDLWICAQVGPALKDKGLIFVGLDVIGDYLTEINVTSPTCIRELDQLFSINIAGRLMDAITTHLS